LVCQSIKTTKTKALAVAPLIEKLISLAKKDTLTAKRKAHQILNDHQLVKLLFDDIGKRFINRVGGYTRILKLGTRRGDNAEMVILELAEIKKKEIRKGKKLKETQAKVEEEKKPEAVEEYPKPQTKAIERPPTISKPQKKFLGGIRNIFKKERDSL
jgi:large subunit ribosomal protein L17